LPRAKRDAQHAHHGCRRRGAAGHYLGGPEGCSPTAGTDGGARVILAARGTHGLDQLSHALRAAGAAAVYTKEFDADDLPAYAQLLRQITTDHGPIGTAVLAFGVLGHQARAEADAAHAIAIVHTDYVAQIHLLTCWRRRCAPWATTKSWCFPRSQARVFDAPTTYTDQPKPDSMASQTDSPMLFTAPEFGC
jgi:hypothetical protein